MSHACPPGPVWTRPSTFPLLSTQGQAASARGIRRRPSDSRTSCAPKRPPALCLYFPEIGRLTRHYFGSQFPLLDSSASFLASLLPLFPWLPSSVYSSHRGLPQHLRPFLAQGLCTAVSSAPGLCTGHAPAPAYYTFLYTPTQPHLCHAVYVLHHNSAWHTSDT